MARGATPSGVTRLSEARCNRLDGALLVKTIMQGNTKLHERECLPRLRKADILKWHLEI